MRWTYNQDQVARNLIETRGFEEVESLGKYNFKFCTEIGCKPSVLEFWKHVSCVARSRGENRKQRRRHKQPAREVELEAMQLPKE
jgi:hypothetical protein